MSKTYKLTQYSHGAGCGCKISPKILNQILENNTPSLDFPNLLVGNDKRDDAAVLDLGDGTAVISTTDFFMPIVDDAEDFGRIASVNAISDVYAMGGTPILAIAILGWPINELPPELANKVIAGSRKACAEAGIPLAGGHSIDSPEPIFGLAVTGRVAIKHLKENAGAKVGNKLFLTKPIGVGILSTSQKKNKLLPEHATLARDAMVRLNKIGTTFAELPYVQAMTDVTGFGILGHLTELCEASNCSAILKMSNIPLLDKVALDYYIEQKCIPGGTNRNWASYGHQVGEINEYQRVLLADPQTSGGLLVAVDAAHENTFLAVSAKAGLQLDCIGEMIPKAEKAVYVKE